MLKAFLKDESAATASNAASPAVKGGNHNSQSQRHCYHQLSLGGRPLSGALFFWAGARNYGEQQAVGPLCEGANDGSQYR